MINIFICGYFYESDSLYVQSHAKKAVEYSSNVFQRKLIDGFAHIGESLIVVSAPFIGSYPDASDIGFFNASNPIIKKEEYVSFFNLWGFRNASRRKNLIRRLKDILSNRKTNDEQIRIFVYSVHTPFLEAAVKIKKDYNDVKIILIAPDLSQYMRLEKSVNFLYRYGKKYDIWKFNKANAFVDGYMLLTEQMRDYLDTHGCPYFVAEGIIDDFDQISAASPESNSKKTVLYAGKLYINFGIQNLVEAFSLIKNDDYQLIICGKGDCEDWIKTKCKENSHIQYLGQLSHDEVLKLTQKATVLVNPRQNNELYTRYSFPSKNLEYLMTGKPVVLYVLDGMKDIYKKFAYIPDDDTIESLKQAIILACEKNNGSKVDGFAKYAHSITASRIAAKLCSLC